MPLMTLLLPLYITLIIDIDAIDITPLHWYATLLITPHWHYADINSRH
jgi:hypothetical protein